MSSARVLGKVATNAALGGEHLPLDRRTCAIEDSEDAIFVFQKTLDSSGSEHKETLKFTQLHKFHNRVTIGGGKVTAADRSAAWVSRGRSELGTHGDLRTQIRRGTNKKPYFRKG